MNYWLVKTEPETFSWETMVKEGNSMWDGVRNYQARNNLRLMQMGDLVLVYHSGKNPGIIGLAEVAKENYPDPTATEGDWSVVELKATRKLNRFIGLVEIKQKQELSAMALIRNTRLSVQPVAPNEFQTILDLEKKAKI